MMQEIITDPVTTNIVGELLTNYGPTGLAFGLLLTIMMRDKKSSEKRIAELEKTQQVQNSAALGTHKEMIADYVELVRNKTAVLADLTGCLKAIKDTLERMERKGNS